jgi:hypothetical protein
MTLKTVKYRDWIFEVDKELTEQTYFKVSSSGADDCHCEDCKNYVANRMDAFPNEIKELFMELGIDFTKEVEIFSLENLPDGLHKISGWFHFKGKVLSGKDYKVPFSKNGYSIDLTEITKNFSIGFSEGNALTYFEDKSGLVQVEFITNIPWTRDQKIKNSTNA